jgi:hypothetical protein
MLYHGTYAQIVRESRKRSPPCSRRHRLDNNSGLCSGKEQTNGGREQFEEDASKEQTTARMGTREEGAEAEEDDHGDEATGRHLAEIYEAGASQGVRTSRGKSPGSSSIGFERVPSGAGTGPLAISRRDWTSHSWPVICAIKLSSNHRGHCRPDGWLLRGSASTEVRFSTARALCFATGATFGLQRPRGACLVSTRLSELLGETLHAWGTVGK